MAVAFPRQHWALGSPTSVEGLCTSSPAAASLKQRRQVVLTAPVELVACDRPLGPAKGFDIHCILFELERVNSRWAEFMMFTESQLISLSEMMQHLLEGGHRGPRMPWRPPAPPAIAEDVEMKRAESGTSAREEDLVQDVTLEVCA